MAVLDSIYNTIAGNIDSLVTGKYAAIVGLVEGPLQVGLAINLIVCGYAIMRGIANEPWGAYLTTWFKAYLVILAATSNFGPWAATLAQNLPDQLVSALGGTNIAGQFDSFIQNTAAASYALVLTSKPYVEELPVLGVPLPDLFAYFLFFLVLIGAYLGASIALVLALFLKFALAITIAVGPIFVGLLVFNSTSGMFFGWLQSALNYSIQSAALALSFVFVTGTVWSFASSVAAGGDSRVAIYLALIYQLAIILVGAFLMLQASSIAASFGGGAASGAGLVSAILPSSRTTRRLAAGGSRLASRGAGAIRRGATRVSRGGVPGATAAVRTASTGITSLRGASSTGPR